MVSVREPDEAGLHPDPLHALYDLAVELSDLQDLDSVLDTALRHCLELTESEFGFVGLIAPDGQVMEVAAIRGFSPSPGFFDRHRTFPLRPNIFSTAVLEDRPVRSTDAAADPLRVGQPGGHPTVGTFLGVPLRGEDGPIGMIGVANRPGDYRAGHERLLLTYAGQIAVVIRNAQLYEQIVAMNQGLERLVEERTRALEEARQSLARKANELQQLFADTIEVQELERQRIARDMHDGVGQLIVGAKLELGSANRLLNGTPNAGSAIESAQEILSNIETEISRIIHDLHPPSLEELGLVPAVRRYAERFGRYSRAECAVLVTGKLRRLAPTAEIASYRLIQEALHNAHAHADADSVTVELSFSDDRLSIAIRDDGRGFDPGKARDEPGHHLGLLSMRERSEALGGTFAISSRPGTGTSVEAVVPLNETTDP